VVGLVGVVAIADAGHLAALGDQLGHLGVADEGERGLPGGGGGQQFEEVPLRHHRDVLVGAGQPVQAHDDGAGIELHRDVVDQPARQPRELGPEPELIEERERRGMNGVAAEVPQEVGVLLENRHPDPASRQKQPEHHACRATSDDHALRVGHVGHLNSSLVEYCLSLSS